MKSRYLLLAFLVVGSPGISAQRPSPSSISGTARVIDGDTFALGKQRVRIAAVDACEKDQVGNRAGTTWPCGVIARSFLSRMIDGLHVTCTVVDRDQYGRLVGQCFDQDQDIAVSLLRAGMVQTMFQFLPSGHGISLEQYIAAEKQARSDNTGIWSAKIEAPGEYRRRQRARELND